MCLMQQLPPNHQEELAERSRKPTKLCIEYHLHKRGSKSQTFALPAPTLPRPRPRNTLTTPPTAGGVVDGEQTEEVIASKSPMEDESTGSVDRLGLVPAASLVELALTPFNNYRNSRRTASVGAKGKAAEGGVRAGATNKPGQMLPPVVKLIVSLLGFESVGPAPPTAAPPGQRTLRDMLWLEKDPTSAGTAAVTKGSRWNGSNISNGATSPPPSGNGIAAGEATAVAEVVAPSPLARVVPVRSPSRSDLPKKGELAIEDDRKIPQNDAVEYRNVSHRVTEKNKEINIRRKIVEDGSVLVRCPRCKACLPVGEAWDAHREEHMSVAALPDLHEPSEVQVCSGKPSSPCHTTALLPSSEAKTSSRHHLSSFTPQPQPPPASELARAAAGTRQEPVSANLRQNGRHFGVDGDTRTSNAAVGVPARGVAAYSSGGDGGDGGDGGRWQSRKLSDLLMAAVTPEQAANVLKERGFMHGDGQTRFANLGLVEDSSVETNSKLHWTSSPNCV